MSQVTEQSVRFQTALASIKLIQASAVLDLTEDDFDFLTSNKVWIATDRSRARRCVEACVYAVCKLLMLICILTKNVITSCSVTMMLFLHLEVKPLMTLTTVLYLSCALISGHLAMMLMELTK